MRISDWSSDVCSSDLVGIFTEEAVAGFEIAGDIAAHFEQRNQRIADDVVVIDHIDGGCGVLHHDRVIHAPCRPVMQLRDYTYRASGVPSPPVKPTPSAMRTRCDRLSAFIFFITFARCISTVRGLIFRW